MAAKACVDFHYPTLKAITKVSENDFSSIVKSAWLRAASAANVISLKVGQKALPHRTEHDASELMPDHSRSAGAQSPGFKRRF
jgi:hypothetical protein